MLIWNGLRVPRWRVSMTSAILLSACAFGSAGASQTHLFQPGDTLFALARRYHVSVEAIAAANHLASADDVRDGRLLLIPDPPHRGTAAPASCRSAIVRGDCVRLRTGPGQDYRRLVMLDDRTPLTVIARRDGWAQVVLSGGQSGWVRGDLLQYRGGRSVPQAGSPPPHASAAASKPPSHASAAVNRPPSHASAAASKPPSHAPAVASKPPSHASAVAGAEPSSGRRAAVPPADSTAQAARQKGKGSPPSAQAAHAGPPHPAPGQEVAQTPYSRHESQRLARGLSVASAPRASGDIVRTAYTYRGTPYVFGGASRGGFDCSGFTSYLYSRQGIALPHTARGQFAMGHNVARSELKPGDLVFFHTVTPGISHVGIYVGNGLFIHASSRRSGGVRVDSLDDGYYQEHFRGARRMRE